MVCSPRCSLQLCSAQAMMTQDVIMHNALWRVPLLLSQVLQPLLSSLLLGTRLRWPNSFKIIPDVLAPLTFT